MAALEGEAFLIGHWKNFEELEDNISIPELEQILESSRDVKRRDQVFLAAIQGIDLDKNTKDTSFEDVKRRAEAKLRGVSEEQVELGDMIGFEEI